MAFTCQICAREIKANTGLIAHHGYQRPWHGSGIQTRSCMGARHLPYEKDCTVLKKYVDIVTTQRDATKTTRDALAEDKFESITFVWRKPTVHKDFGSYTITKTHGIQEENRSIFRQHGVYDWVKAVEHKLAEMNYELKHIGFELDRVVERLSKWRAPS